MCENTEVRRIKDWYNQCTVSKEKNDLRVSLAV